jgi:hypothetical protein
MRTVLLVAWLLVPIGVGIWHHGPGQDRVQTDEAAKLLAQADRHAKAGEWAEAAALYEEALKLLPAGKEAEARRIRLERAKAQMLCGQLPAARADLETLVEELQAAGKADGKLLASARTALAQSQFYMTWLMRLEGLPRELWEPEIEAARQTYRLLAEQAKGDAESAKKNKQDLEAAIRLARLDLSELQGLPLPSQ